MKKIALLALIMCLGFAGKAQENPNRMIVQPKSGNPQGYLIERLDSVYFAEITGRVAADVVFKEFKTGANDTIMVAVTKTADCQGFRITCIPSVLANKLTDDAAVARYFEQIGGQMYYQDFTNAEMTGFEIPFKAKSNYTLLTMGYDKYGIACSSSKADFTTPAAQLAGSPAVTWTIDEVGTQSFKITFTPNNDCKSYATCSFKKGEAQKQFEQWGPMMGFVNMSDMIKQFSGPAYTTVNTQEWTAMAPGTEYEVYVLPIDANGNYADLAVIAVTTKQLGGEGTATVAITAGEFGGSATTGYYQKVTYTPNDQCAVHRDMIITKEMFNTAEWGESGVIKFLKSETNPNNPYDTYWNQYGVDIAQWNADPSTEYIAFSIAKNAKNEWGPLAKLEITTPATPGGAPAKAVPGKRLNAGNSVINGVSPLNGKSFMPAPRGLKLEQK